MKKNITLSIFSFFFFFILAEFVLTLSGTFMKTTFQETLGEDEDFTIVCIGESTTALGGSSSYPSLLKEELDKVGNKVKIVNRGQTAVSIYDFTQRLEKIYTQDKPHVVILMLGINDYGNDSAHLQTPFIISKFSQYSKVVKLLRNAIVSWKFKKTNDVAKATMTKDKIPHIPVSSELKNLVELQKFNQLKTNLKILPTAQRITLQEYIFHVFESSNQEANALMIYNYESADNELKQSYYFSLYTYEIFMKLNLAQKATEIAESFVKRKKYLVGLHSEVLRNSLKRNQEEQFRSFFQEFKKDAITKKDHTFFMDVIKISLELKNTKLANEILKEMKASFPYNYYIQDHYINQNNTLVFRAKNISDYLFTLKHSQEYYETIVKFFLEKGVYVISMQYPTIRNYVMRKRMGVKKGLFYHENYRNFQVALSNHNYSELFWDSFGGSFGHFTEKSSRIVAEGLVPIITKIKQDSKKRPL